MKIDWKIVVSFSLLSLLTLSFQNCGTSMDGLTTDETPGASTLSEKYGRDASKVETAPFAFSAALDQITYTSCSDSNSYNDNSIFSIRAGAYDSGGVALSEDFLNYVNSNFLPIPPEKVITSEQYKSILADSPENKGAELRFGLRSPANLQSMVTIGSSTQVPVEGIDYIKMGPGLSSDKALTQLIQTPGIHQHFFNLGDTPTESLIEGSLYFSKDNSQAKAFRDAFTNDATLALTYAHSELLTAARGPDIVNEPQKAYGKGYKLQFAPANSATFIGSLFSGAPSQFLVGIQESNLDGSTTNLKPWSCSHNHRYLIVRPTERAAYCPKESFAQIANSASARAELVRLRRHLPANLWDINISLKCVVPKVGSCYTAESGISIQYDQSKACYFPGNGSTVKERCANFVSVCFRN